MAYTPKGGKFAGQEFGSYRQYRNALARLKGFGSLAQQQRSKVRVKNAQAFASLNPLQRDARERSLEALSLMRRKGFSLREAAEAAGTTPNTVRRYMGDNLERTPKGFRAKPRDREFRSMRFLTAEGPVYLPVTDSRTASTIGEYWEAVKLYLQMGNDRALRRFKYKQIRVQKKTYNFVTDTKLLERLGRAGELDFESIYES